MRDNGPNEILAAELARRRAAGEVQIIDVRTDEEWAEGRISGSRHITLNEVSAAAEELDKEHTVVFVCSVGNRSAMAAEAFSTGGFDAYSLAGGLKAWAEDGREVETD
jgi:rhodanese-related sulfurtransferase